MLPTWILWLVSPLGRYAAMAIVAFALYSAWTQKVRYDERTKIYAQEKVQRQHAIKKGAAARSRALQRYDAGRLHDDGFARD